MPEEPKVGKFSGKVIVVTGAARGQGRSHAVGAAEEGADIIGIDLCHDIASNRYSLASEPDLADTAQLIEKAGRKAVMQVADVRDLVALKKAVDQGVTELGRLDGLVANAGICPLGNDDPQAFLDAANVCFLGVANAVTACLPHMRAGASIVAIGSIASMMTHEATPSGLGGIGAGGLGYMWAKRTVASYVHDLALVLGPRGIRANAVHPTNVNTDMLRSKPMFRVFRPDLEEPTLADAEPGMYGMHPMSLGYVEPHDVTKAVLYLLSDDARFVTGTQMRVDGGAYVLARPQTPYF
jgi:SDR family mycofactocin-dependent oxidoreductase